MQQIFPFIWNFLFCFNMSSKQIAKAITNNNKNNNNKYNNNREKQEQEQQQFKNSNFQMKIDGVAH